MEGTVSPVRRLRTCLFPVVLLSILLHPSILPAVMYREVPVDFNDGPHDRNTGCRVESPSVLRIPGDVGGGFVYISETVESPYLFNAVGLTFFAEVEDPLLIQVFARTSTDLIRWGEWMLLPPDEDLYSVFADPERGEITIPFLATSLLFRDRGDGAAIQIMIRGDGASGEDGAIYDLKAVFLNSVDGPTERDILRSREARGESCLPYPGGCEVAHVYPKPPVVSRDEWGADPPQGQLYWYTVTHLCLHHTASVSDWGSQGFDECAARVRAIQAYHMGLGWVDIGYNFLVCKHGLVWEGREGGDDVVGTHDGSNWGSMGASCMGYFHPPYNHEPTYEMLNSLAELYAWKCDHRDIEPFGYGWYYGYGASMDNIYGHRQVGATACPGDILFPMLPEIRQEVADRLGGGGWSNVCDTDMAMTRGDWYIGTMAQDKYGPDYLWTTTEPGGRFAAGWRFAVPRSDQYEVFAWWSQGTNRSTEARFGIKHAHGVTFVTRNQQENGGMWNSLGTYSFQAGRHYLMGVLNDAPIGYVVICDAGRIVKR